MSERMPPLAPEAMSEEQKKAVADIIAGPRGRIVGPFNVMLRSPEMMNRVQHLGEYLRFNCVLGERLKEMVVLLTARNASQAYEWKAHYPIALDAGLSKDIADAIGDGRRPTEMAEDEAVVYDFCTELFAGSLSVSDATYERAVTAFGEQGVVEMTGVSGYYSLIAMMLNVGRTALPDGAKPAIERFPR